MGKLSAVGAATGAAHGWAVDHAGPGLAMDTERRRGRLEVSLRAGVLRRSFEVQDFRLGDESERAAVADAVRAELDHYRAFFDAVGPACGWDGAWDRDEPGGAA